MKTVILKKLNLVTKLTFCQLNVVAISAPINQILEKAEQMQWSVTEQQLLSLGLMWIIARCLENPLLTFYGEMIDQVVTFKSNEQMF